MSYIPVDPTFLQQLPGYGVQTNEISSLRGNIFVCGLDLQV